MTNNRYTIGDLENETGLKRRTIHYYSKKGVIPPPEGAGLGSFYTDVHLYRLMLIKHLKKSHLKLTGITEAFDAMSVDDMCILLKRVEKEKPDWKLDSLENWMLQEPKLFEDTSMFQSDIVVKESDESGYYKSNYMEQIKRKTPEATSWDKITLEDGVEVHIRADKSKKKINIVNAIKKLMENSSE
ncbi:MAG: MerR family transcriptional regulator [Candidatus Marinimicrobia bacterium]|nr:MerR family transcriptional regulator [Candidatus Neomarinimicrobiota bacterium]